MDPFGVPELRSLAIASMMSSVTSIGSKVFAEAHRLSGALCDGDVGENLRMLGKGECPSEQVGAQLWSLWQHGWPPQALIDIVANIRDLPRSTFGVEQQQASTALMKGMHPSMHQDMLRCRAHTQCIRALVSPLRPDGHVRRLHSLRRRVPARLNARGAYPSSTTPARVGGRKLHRRAQTAQAGDNKSTAEATDKSTAHFTGSFWQLRWSTTIHHLRPNTSPP